jgi:hypothetical protein
MKSPARTATLHGPVGFIAPRGESVLTPLGRGTGFTFFDPMRTFITCMVQAGAELYRFSGLREACFREQFTRDSSEKPELGR